MKAVEEKLHYPVESRILVAKREEDSFPFEWHYHNAFEITLVLEGEGQRFVGDSIQDYKKGDLVFLPPELAHTWKSADTSKVNKAIYIQFNENCLGYGAFGLEDFREVQELFRSSQGFVFCAEKPTKKLFLDCLSAQGIEKLIAFLKILKKLSRLKREYLASKDYKTSKDDECRKMMDKLMSLINKDVCLKVPEIASELNMSESTFRRFIKKNTGRSFIDFSNLMQISKACQLIINSQKSISEVAMDCGYRNLSHFNKKFKEYKGLTPKEFRQSYN